MPQIADNCEEMFQVKKYQDKKTIVGFAAQDNFETSHHVRSLKGK